MNEPHQFWPAFASAARTSFSAGWLPRPAVNQNHSGHSPPAFSPHFGTRTDKQQCAFHFIGFTQQLIYRFTVTIGQSCFPLNILRFNVPAKADGLKLTRQRLVKFIIIHAQKHTGRKIHCPAGFHGFTTEFSNQQPARLYGIVLVISPSVGFSIAYRFSPGTPAPVILAGQVSPFSLPPPSVADYCG